ncbi:MAG: trehalose-6-phosphate synthase [Hyphomonas sp.]
MGRLVAISNRTAADPGGKAGGLAVAVWDALKVSGGLWAGWSGEILASNPSVRRESSEDGVSFLLMDLTEDEYEGYYLEFSNSALWPVFHHRVDLAVFEHDAFEAYVAVNDRLAGLVAAELQSTDIVWAHDYHFLPMAQSLRRAGWQGRTGFFLHIPFPTPDIFRALPEHAWLARALCAYDLIGFQSESDRSNFARYLVDSCDAEAEAAPIYSVFGRKVHLGVYPIGIDAVGFEEAAESPEAKRAAGLIGKFLDGRLLIIGVDRMDYSKGLPQRFEAVGELFDNYPELHGKVSVTQIATPSRTKVEEYRELRRELNQLAGQINGDYGDLDWIPLRYLARAYSREELAGLFRIARVGLVTPLRDGMNLVAKEYVMAQDPEDPGVLILSEFAGAAEQLSAALIVNPHDRRTLSETIHQALTMPLEERKARWKSLRDIVVKQDVAWWRECFLSDLTKVS